MAQPETPESQAIRDQTAVMLSHFGAMEYLTKQLIDINYTRGAHEEWYFRWFVGGDKCKYTHGCIYDSIPVLDN
jgi:hypothetical protein